MRLLLDENLSRRMLPFLQAHYPESTQVGMVGLESASDVQVWDYAKANHFTIVTCDADFEELSIVWGQPPQVIWLKTANASKEHIQRLLIENFDSINNVLAENKFACLELTG
jgi:predicted nuclease of predicted toxin-antitoxin system